jgi:hypothetical protein
MLPPVIASRRSFASSWRRQSPLAGSLGVDAALVAIGTAVFPSTKGYVHFQFHDYVKLTVIARLVWPIVTRISSVPRWLFFRLVSS